ncbi:uncharacterized protein OCT59_019937 [Rhizophagus irregularis]|uniref:uncharacterized protein n=1 Tax=Rhizophagus irregularis TaxID=588596 RepID=UPI00331E8BD8|nr:hypothetical protein OCT59_019937 [Rhizophagus irregularis]
MVIKNLWNFVYEEFKQRIWIPRCDEINEIELLVTTGILQLRLTRCASAKDGNSRNDPSTKICLTAGIQVQDVRHVECFFLCTPFEFGCVIVVRDQLPKEITKTTLWKKTEQARKIYLL